MTRLREILQPGIRGAAFYAAYWGITGLFEAFLFVHFLRLGFSGGQIGWLAAIFPLFNFVISTPISRLADRKARRVLILAVAAGCYGACLVLLSIPTTFLSLLPIYALVMAARSPVVPLADSLVARMAERHSLDFGSMRMWGSIAFMVTSMSMGALWQRTGFQVMFVVSGICFSLVALAAFLLDETPPAPAPAPGSAVVKVGLPEPGILFLLAAGFLVVGSLFMNGIFGSVYMTLIGGTEMHVGALFGLTAMGEVPGMLFGRRLARRIGDTNTLLIACVITAIGSGGYAFATTPYMLLACGVLRGLGFGTYLVSTVTILNHRAPANMYATYQSLVNAICWGLAPLLGGPTAGYIYENFGPATLFTISGSMGILAAVLMLPTYRLWRSPPPSIPHITSETP